MKKAKKIIMKLVNILSLVIVACSVVILLSVIFTKPGDIPNIGGYRAMRILTGSMAPELPVNSFIIVKQQDASTIVPGDIISFYSQDPELDGMVNTHRVVEVEQTADGYAFHTKGDASKIEDLYPAAEADLIGKVVFSSRQLGVAVRLISNPLIFVPLVIAPLLFILLHNLFQIVGTAKSIAREEEEAYLKSLEYIRAKKRKEAEARRAAEAENALEAHGQGAEALADEQADQPVSAESDVQKQK